MTYTVELTNNMGAPQIVVVGCGGTGSFVAEDLCRILFNSDLELLLVDYDRIEPHNLRRQNFFKDELGKFKSQALAERLSRQYDRRVGYTVFPYDRDVLNDPTIIGIRQVRSIIIGCVDNAAARRDIASTLKHGDWWLDSGNGYQSGQILIGNATRIEYVQGSFTPSKQEVRNLPIPSLQLPSLLQESGKSTNMDCAEAIESNEQSPTINRVMATWVIEFVYRLLKGTLSWMGAYIDMDAGTTKTVPADPETVGRMFSVSAKSLLAIKDDQRIPL